MIDSGAAQNIIRDTLINNDVQEKQRKIFGMACGNNIVESLGSIKQTFNIQDQPFSTHFEIIPDLNEQVILGAPFLHQENMTIDYGRKCLYLGINKRLTVYWDQSQPHILTRKNIHEKLIIPEEHAEQLSPIFREYAELFTEIPTPATTVTTTHSINLRDTKPINIKPYPMSPSKKKLLYEQIQEMLQNGIIESSASPYSFPPVIVEREGKKPRFCIDYRRLNEITENETSTLPKIHDALKDLGNAKIFTLLDLKSGYWQVPMKEEHKPLTAFSTPDGATYQFKVMPFGLKTAPATFQNLMARDVLPGLLHHFVTVYLDDILIYSPTAEQHRIDLQLVFERLRQHNLKVSPEKCRVAVDNLEYLGHHIQGNIVTPQNKHLKCIQEFPQPTTKRQLQSFLGTINWVREYIPNR